MPLTAASSRRDHRARDRRVRGDRAGASNPARKGTRSRVAVFHRCGAGESCGGPGRGAFRREGPELRGGDSVHDGCARDWRCVPADRDRCGPAIRRALERDIPSDRLPCELCPVAWRRQEQRRHGQYEKQSHETEGPNARPRCQGWCMAPDPDADGQGTSSADNAKSRCRHRPQPILAELLPKIGTSGVCIGTSNRKCEDTANVIHGAAFLPPIAAARRPANTGQTTPSALVSLRSIHFSSKSSAGHRA
jgi:hypothetical protein